MSDHGVLMFLASTRTDRWVECYAAYNVLFHENEDQVADYDIESAREYSAVAGSVEVTQRMKGKLGSLAAVRVVMRYKVKDTGIKMVRDSTVALRAVIKDYEVPSHEYSVSLTTPENLYMTDRLALEPILKSWQTGPADE